MSRPRTTSAPAQGRAARPRKTGLSDEPGPRFTSVCPHGKTAPETGFRNPVNYPLCGQAPCKARAPERAKRVVSSFLVFFRPPFRPTHIRLAGIGGASRSRAEPP
ncbi:Uncharacterized protein ToN1_36130 [Aromatoleum petrolei]|nr:Uncharacterized protein ToN1_36130 [Aromatoleum petrolei]